MEDVADVAEIPVYVEIRDIVIQGYPVFLMT